MSVDRAFISELIEATDLVGLISENLTLKRQGSEFAACCPFHQEDTPSFTVSSKKQFFYCFGCKAHGNAIDFLMKFFGLPFRDSVEQLCGRAGLNLPDSFFSTTESRKEAEERKSKYEMLQKAMSRLIYFYERQWSTPLGQEAKHYLMKERGLKAQTLKHFHVGISAWSGELNTYFSNEEIQSLIEANVFRNRPQGLTEVFRNRIIFPIQNERQRWVGFGGRSIRQQQQPKYLNSAETPWFQKRKLLFGFAEAKEACRNANLNLMKAEDVLLVEGYLDVFACHQLGLKQVVATLGTAISDQQLTMLFRNFDRLFVCYDGDTAGKRATQKLIDRVLPYLNSGKSVFFVELPDNKDPADCLLKPAAHHQLVDAFKQALPLSCKLFDPKATEGLQYAEGRAEFLRSLELRIQKIPDPFFQEELKRIENGYRQNFMAPNVEKPLLPERASELQKFEHRAKGSKPESGLLAKKRPLRIIFSLLIQNPELIEKIQLNEVVHRWLPRLLKNFVSDILKQDHQTWQESSLAQRLLIWKGTPVESILKEISFWDHLIDPLHWAEELQQAFQSLAEQACHQRLKKFLAISKQRRLKQEEMSIYCQALKELQMLREGRMC